MDKVPITMLLLSAVILIQMTIQCVNCKENNNVISYRQLSDIRFKVKNTRLDERCNTYYAEIKRVSSQESLEEKDLISENESEIFANLIRESEKMDSQVKRDLEDCIVYYNNRKTENSSVRLDVLESELNELKSRSVLDLLEDIGDKYRFLQVKNKELNNGEERYQSQLKLTREMSKELDDLRMKFDDQAEQFAQDERLKQLVKDRYDSVVLSQQLSSLSDDDKESLLEELSLIDPAKHYLSKKALLKLYKMKLILNEEPEKFSDKYNDKLSNLIREMENNYIENIGLYMDVNFNEATNDNWILTNGQTKYKSQCQLAILSNLCQIVADLSNLNNFTEVTASHLKNVANSFIESSSHRKIDRLAELANGSIAGAAGLYEDCVEADKYLVPLDRLDQYQEWLGSNSHRFYEEYQKNTQFSFYSELRNLCRLIIV